MQKVELALKGTFDYIGDDYDYPQGEFITDEFGNSDTLRNPYEGQSPTPVKFMFGTQKELNIWLNTTKEKYPVVWLVYPLTEKNDMNSPVYIYEKMRLVFAIDNSSDKLVPTRLQTTRFVLDQIVKAFLDLMKNSQFKGFLSLDKDKGVVQKFYPNYSAKRDQDNQIESGSVDIWDAIALDCTLHYKPSCYKLIIKNT